MSNPNKQNQPQNRNQQPAPTQVAKDQPSEQIAPQKNYLDEPAIAPIIEDLTKGSDAPRPKSDNVAIFEDRL